MSEVKVKGVLDENGIKNFMITNKETGEVHVALRDGQKFVLGEFRGTLAQCKQLVAASKVVHFADAEPEPEPESNRNTWDCVHPCALLILKSDELRNAEVLRTLDNFGWLLPNGEPDLEGARKNYDRWSK